LDLHLVLEAGLSLAVVLAANWIRGIRQDVHEIVKTVQDHGERLAVVESQVRDLRER